MYHCGWPSSRQKPVIGEEAHEGGRRKRHHLPGRTAPDGARHGQQIVPAEPVAEPHACEEFAQADLRIAFDHVDRRGIEAEDLAEETVERGSKEVAALREDGVGAFRPPFEPAVAHRQRETHVALFNRDAQPAEKRRQVGVVALIVDDEARVDGNLPVAMVDDARTRVPADARVFFVNRNLVVRVKLVSSRQARNPASNDRDFCHGGGTGSGARRIMLTVWRAWRKGRSPSSIGGCG